MRNVRNAGYHCYPDPFMVIIKKGNNILSFPQSPVSVGIQNSYTKSELKINLDQ